MTEYQLREIARATELGETNLREVIEAMAAHGLVVVPKEPTDKMYRAALSVSRSPDYEADDTIGGAIYRAMIAAATQEPKP